MLVYGWNKMPVDGGIDDSMDKYVVVVVHKQRWDATTHGEESRSGMCQLLDFLFLCSSTSPHFRTPHNNRKELGFAKKKTPIIDIEEHNNKSMACM